MNSVLTIVSANVSAFGGGDPLRGAVFVLAGLVIVAFAFAMLALYRAGPRKVELPPGVDRLPNLLAKFDRLERDMAELRAEVQRPLELLRNEIAEMRGSVGSAAPAGKQPVVEPAPEKKTRALSLEVNVSEPAVAREVSQTAATTERVAPEALSNRLSKTRRGFFGSLRRLLTGKTTFDAAAVEELEALLIGSDLGVRTVERLMSAVKAAQEGGGTIGEAQLTQLCREQIVALLERAAPQRGQSLVRPVRRADGPTVVLMVGVNGVGKTTTSAKLAARWKNEGASVLLVAADTFRAAAVEQLNLWGARIGVPVVAGAADAKPATVVFEAMARAQKENIDVVIVDTAGRLHTKANLMQELEGVYNSITKHQSSGPHETLLVLDGSTGQNALMQAKEFNAAVKLTGLVVTKLDGTPKGGIVVAIAEELGVPVRFVGVGEAAGDLRPFIVGEFVDALFDSVGIEGEGAGEASNANQLKPELSAHGAVRRRRREGAEVVGG